MPARLSNQTEQRIGTFATIGVLFRLLKPFWLLASLATLLGLASGGAAVALLSGINTALDKGSVAEGLLALIGLVAVTLGTAFASEVGNTVVGQRVVTKLRRDLCRQIAEAPQAQVEQVSGQRLLAVLTGDLEALSAATLNIAPIAVAAATVLGGFVTLAWQSLTLFLIVAVALAIGAFANAQARRAGIRKLEAMRDAQEDLFGNFRAIVDGGKELRMNRTRRAQVLDTRLIGAIGKLARLSIHTRCMFGAADAAGSGLFFAAIILVLMFGQNAGAAASASYVLLLLYLRAPLEQLVAALPTLARAQVALRRVIALSKSLTPETMEARRSEAPAAFTEIALRGATYAYPETDQGRGFAVGPLDLTLKPGEIVFITGENGAGKSTMIKLLTGLYAPDNGAVTLDGLAVTPSTRDTYRQLFSTVFFDFHLFDELVLPAGTSQAEVDHWLTRLGLAGKVSVTDGRLSTTRLSAGQRKRLALLQVFLEGRPVVALDEWAAEQDPIFRRVFYTELLPEMRRRGMTVVAITHDDRYFNTADRCIMVGADGRLTEGAAGLVAAA